MRISSAALHCVENREPSTFLETTNCRCNRHLLISDLFILFLTICLTTHCLNNHVKFPSKMGKIESVYSLKFLNKMTPINIRSGKPERLIVASIRRAVAKPRFARL